MEIFYLSSALPLPSEIGNLGSLRDLGSYDLQSAVGTLPAELGRLTNLTIAFFLNGAFTGQLPSELGRLTSMSQLRLSKPIEQTGLSGTIPTELASLVDIGKLRILDLSCQTDLTGTIPEAMCFLESPNCTFVQPWGAIASCILQVACGGEEFESYLCGCNCNCTDSDTV